jgi:hypothetical protein
MKSKTTPLIFTLLLLLLTTSTIAQNEKIKKPFPSEISKNVKFGMSKTDFLKKFPDAEIVKEENFRTTVYQKTGSRDVTGIGYYFGTKDNEPLYEIIVNFNSESMAESRALELLKQANFKNKEWRYTYKKRPLWCWVYKAKIVYVARIPGTEWDEDWDRN